MTQNSTFLFMPSKAFFVLVTACHGYVINENISLYQHRCLRFLDILFIFLYYEFVIFLHDYY